MSYYYDNCGRPTTIVDPTRETDQAPPSCPSGEQPIWAGQGWACLVFTAPSALQGLPTRCNAYKWYRMFTEAERTAILQLANTDARVVAFMHVLEMCISAGYDVVSTDPDLIDAMNYLQTVPASTPCLTAARAAQLIAMI